MLNHHTEGFWVHLADRELKLLPITLNFFSLTNCSLDMILKFQVLDPNLKNVADP